MGSLYLSGTARPLLAEGIKSPAGSADDSFGGGKRRHSVLDNKFGATICGNTIHSTNPTRGTKQDPAGWSPHPPPGTCGMPKKLSMKHVQCGISTW